MVSIYTVIYN